MKMGIKEFREKIGEVSLGDEVVIVTHHGRRVGRFVPEGRRRQSENIDMKTWSDDLESFGRDWRTKTPNWRELLREIDTPEVEIAEIEEHDRCS